jgi:uncharacterized protein YceH (UPF0502 family)
MVDVMDEWDELLAVANLEAGLAADEADDADQQWVTLAEAEARAAVSRSALRTWYRTGQLPSRVVDGAHGPQRLVPLEAVEARAGQSPRIRRKAARGAGIEAEVAALRERVADLERRLAAVEGQSDEERRP